MRLAVLILEFSVFFKSLFSSEYAQGNVWRRVIGLFAQQRNLWCVWFMIRARRLNLEETAISSTCVRLIARPVVQHTCIITPKIINIRNRMYYSKKHTCFHCFYEAIFTNISHFNKYLRGRDLAYNTFVPFNFIPTFFRTRRTKLKRAAKLWHFPDQKRVLRACSVSYKLVFTKIQKYQK